MFYLFSDVSTAQAFVQTIRCQRVVKTIIDQQCLSDCTGVSARDMEAFALYLDVYSLPRNGYPRCNKFLEKTKQKNSCLNLKTTEFFVRNFFLSSLKFTKKKTSNFGKDLFTLFFV